MISERMNYKLKSSLWKFFNKLIVSFLLTVSYYHVTYEYPHSIVCLSVKELLARSMCLIWSLIDSNVIRTHNQTHTRNFNKDFTKHITKLAKLTKWLSGRLRTKWLWVGVTLLSLNFFFLYSAFCDVGSN